jgi:hypothetical protein
MKNILVPYKNNISEMNPDSDSYKISNLLWSKTNYKPEVVFNIAHNSKNIFLKFKISEKYIVANTEIINGDVWKDSCVEFFAAPDYNNNDSIYYNFEINCIGTVLLAAGNSRYNREFADNSIIKKIETNSSLGSRTFSEKQGNFIWYLSVIIPVECFFKHKIERLDNKIFNANFYKCGDSLSEPHYLSWNRIRTAKPDFHRPEYFGRITFSNYK